MLLVGCSWVSHRRHLCPAFLSGSVKRWRTTCTALSKPCPANHFYCPIIRFSCPFFVDKYRDGSFLFEPEKISKGILSTGCSNTWFAICPSIFLINALYWIILLDVNLYPLIFWGCLTAYYEAIQASHVTPLLWICLLYTDNISMEAEIYKTYSLNRKKQPTTKASW